MPVSFSTSSCHSWKWGRKILKAQNIIQVKIFLTPVGTIETIKPLRYVLYRTSNEVRSSSSSISSELENMWSRNWTDTKSAMSHMPLSELWDKKALHMRTSAQDHMLPRFRLRKKLICYDSGEHNRFLSTAAECEP